MSIHEDTAYLRKVPPFAVLAQKKLQLLAYMGDRVTYRAGDVVITQGATGDAVYVLMEGEANVTIEREGKSESVRRLDRYAFFGELAVINETERAATVTAATDISVLKISENVLNTMIEDLPDLKNRIVEHINNAGYYRNL